MDCYQKFKEKQKIFEIGGVKFGGAFGETPTVMIASLFYPSHKVVLDHKSGKLDKKKAKEEIETHLRICEELGLGQTLDVIAETPEAMVSYLEFIFEVADGPIMVDGTIPAVRLAGAKYAYEVGENKRVIYDSISPDTKNDELEELKDYKIEGVVLLALNQFDFTPKGKVELIEKNLLPKAKIAGIDKILIDTIVFDVPSIGLAAEAIYTVKDKFGYPTGTAPCNATFMILDQWRYSEASFVAMNAAMIAMIQTLGADYVFYGRIDMAEELLPAAAITNGVIAYTSKMLGRPVKLSKEHPLYRSMKK
ncbi:MAG: hypothetical protein ACP6IU_06295 [Candidatus Asgardarchaeia archaeon]